jgi:hypothetical protein
MAGQHSRHGIFSWWEQKGETVIRHALHGGSFSKQFKGEPVSSLSLHDFQAVYALDAVYQDAFVVTPPDRLVVFQSFFLIGSFWDVRVESLGPPQVQMLREATSAVSDSAANLRVPYILAQRSKLMRWTPWWHTYSGYIDLYLQQERDENNDNSQQHPTNWKIKEHDDRIDFALPWSDTPTNMTDFLISFPLFGAFFHAFREYHGKAVDAMAVRSNQP